MFFLSSSKKKTSGENSAKKECFDIFSDISKELLALQSLHTSATY